MNIILYARCTGRLWACGSKENIADFIMFYINR